MRPMSFILLLALCSVLFSQVPPLDTILVVGPPDIYQPVFVCAPPGDLQRLFVVEKNGLIKIRLATGSVVTFLDLNALISAGSEQGLLGMAFHPNYATNGYFYVNYTNTTGATVIARYTVSANPDVANAASGLAILTVTRPSTSHNAGWLQFGPDGYLYIAMGDGDFANDPAGNAQNTGLLLGKILRIDVDNPAGGLNYGIPPSNPFVGAGNPRDEIWAIGVRNPFRCSFDRLTGDLWIGDVGQDTREEIDFQPATDAAGIHGGRNYGWRCMEGTLCTGLSGCACSSAPLTNPIHDYSSALPAPEKAVISGYVYRGCAIPQLRGHYFFADYGSYKIWTLQYDGTTVTGPVDRTADLDPAGPDTIFSIVSFGEDGNGELYIVEREGSQIWKIVPTTPQMVGVTSYGTGTPGCNGPHVLSFGCSPTIFNPGETLNSTNGSAGTIGIFAISDAPLSPGSDPLGIGVETLIGFTPGLALFEFLVGTGGVTMIPTAIPNAPWLVGVTIYVQEFFVWAACVPSPLSISSSPALALTIQP